MKKILINLLLALPISLFGQTAEIKIDVERKIAEIDPKIYGVFMEPIHFKGERIGLSDSVDFNKVFLDPGGRDRYIRMYRRISRIELIILCCFIYKSQELSKIRCRLSINRNEKAKNIPSL
jgi:hypothetical protein